MTDDKHDRAFERRIAATLDAGCTRLDSATRQRLDRARRMALNQTRPANRAWMMLPALATACAVMVAVVMVARQPSPQLERESPFDLSSVPLITDLDLLTRPEFELFVEDPDFIAWLADDELPADTRPEPAQEQSG